MNKWQIQPILSLVIAYCTWGLWDTINFTYWTPGQKFPLPFNIVYLEPQIAGDLFVSLIAVCLVLMLLAGSGKKELVK